jgi:general stress protein 26
MVDPMKDLPKTAVWFIYRTGAYRSFYRGGKRMNTNDPKAFVIMDERFGHDTLISLATLEGSRPAVRIVNSYYEDGSFYTVTYALSNKMLQIRDNPQVAICGEWFSAHGTGENIGHPRDEKNKTLAAKLRKIFAEWYENGHTDEDDPNTCILRVRLTDGVLFSHGTKYEIDFTAVESGN